MGTDAVHIGLTRNMDDLSPVVVDDEASKSPLDETQAGGCNQMEQKQEADAPMTSSGYGQPGRSPFDHEGELTSRNVQYVVKSEPYTEESVGSRCPSVSDQPSVSGSVPESSSIVNEEHLTSEDEPYAKPELSSRDLVDVQTCSVPDVSPAAVPLPSSSPIDSKQNLISENPVKCEPTHLECFDGESSHATMPSVGNSIPECSLSPQRGTGENAVKLKASPGYVDSQSDPAIAPSLVDSVHKGSPVASGDALNNNNDKTGNTVQLQPMSHDCVDAQGSTSIVPSMAGDATHESLSVVSEKHMTKEDASEVIESLPTAEQPVVRQCAGDVSTVRTVVAIPAGELNDPVAKGNTSNRQESCKEKDSGVGKQVTVDPGGNDPDNLVNTESSRGKSVQLCEVTGKLISNTTPAPSSVPNMTDASKDEDSMPRIENEEQSNVHSNLPNNQPEGTVFVSVHIFECCWESAESLTVTYHLIAGIVTSPQPAVVARYVSERGERKPSSADEEMAVVSLLQLRTGHASDDTTSSSTEQE